MQRLVHPFVGAALGIISVSYQFTARFLSCAAPLGPLRFCQAPIPWTSARRAFLYIADRGIRPLEYGCPMDRESRACRLPTLLPPPLLRVPVHENDRRRRGQN